MSETSGSAVLGAAMYALGVVLSAAFLGPDTSSAIFHPALELVVVSLAVLVLAPMYYGRVSYLLLLIVGAAFAAYVQQKPIFVVAAAAPLIYAMKVGAGLGVNAYEDLKGKKNLFEDKGRYFAHAAWIIIASAAIGYFLADVNVSAWLPQASIIDGIIADVNWVLSNVVIE